MFALRLVLLELESLKNVVHEIFPMDRFVLLPFYESEFQALIEY